MEHEPPRDLTLRARTFEVLERGRHGAFSYFFDVFITVIILANVVASVIDTVPGIHASYGGLLHRFDTACVFVFIAEYLARLWVAPEHPMMRGHGAVYARLRTVVMPLMILDLVAILPFFLELIFGFDVAVIRVIRIIRFYRLARYVPAMAMIVLAGMPMLSWPSPWRRLTRTTRRRTCGMRSAL